MALDDEINKRFNEIKRSRDELQCLFRDMRRSARMVELNSGTKRFHPCSNSGRCLVLEQAANNITIKYNKKKSTCLWYKLYCPISTMSPAPNCDYTVLHPMASLPMCSDLCVYLLSCFVRKVSISFRIHSMFSQVKLTEGMLMSSLLILSTGGRKQAHHIWCFGR